MYQILIIFKVLFLYSFYLPNGLCPKPHILSWLLHLLFYFKGVQQAHSTSCSIG